MVVVGPGFKLHRVFNPQGPYNIRILEIDLSNQNNKLETVLARDVLGTGFEKTSSMAARKNKPGKIVIGAINGDFFGISYPNNPYTFLSGSQVINREYAQAHNVSGSIFGIKSDLKPIIESIKFSGSIKAKNNNTFTISAFNDTCSSNTMILYNKYFGNQTKTNNTTSEVKLKPLGNFQLNSAQKFVVLQKQLNTGNMSFNADEYVMSGNGTAATFIQNNISAGDTISITIGTSPNKGDITQMIGGGVVLVQNGVVPTFTNTDVHPRTAIGFNQDSTKIFFVTVDGRQPGFSVGMSYEQLGKYMKGIGCYQALNLDGGGSTTMVVRGVIENSPSDAAGERSVANCLIAVCEAPTNEIIDSLSLSPKQINIDTTQIKKINCNGIDKWGYKIEVNPKDISWQIIGINGYVDTLGFFHPINSGSGYIIGSLNNLRDTISVTVSVERFPIWSMSAAGNNLPSWFSSTGSTERGLAYGFVDNKHRVYVVSRPNAYILDAATGDKVGDLNTTGISGGTFTLNDIDVSSDGIIFGCNLTTNSGSSAFKVYKWLNETAQPQQVISFNSGAYRLGDKFTVIGNVSSGTATVYAAAQATNKVLRWTMQGGEFIQTATEITLSDITSCGTSPSVAPVSEGISKFYLNGYGIYPKEYNANGTIINTMNTTVVPTGSNAIRYFEKNGRKFLVTYIYGFGNENAKIVDITKGIENAELVETTPSLGSNANNIAITGDVAVRDYNDKIVIVYVLACNNGLGAYAISIDSISTNITENINENFSFTLSQNYPNPFNPITNIKYSLNEAGFVTLKIYDVLGKEIEVLVNDYKNAGVYYHSWDGTEYSSGIYFYELKLMNNKKFIKSKTGKMILVK